MGAVKIRQADRWFSKCVRKRAGYRCERCGAQHAENSPGLHCSHFHGRGKWSVRFDPENCEALCYGCHMHLTANPQQHHIRILGKLGTFGFEALQERAHDTRRGRLAKKEERQISRHYKSQFEEMQLFEDFVGYL